MRNAPLQTLEAVDPAGKIVAVVVTLNRLGQIRRTIAALLASPINQIVVVDNGSDDGTRDWLLALDEPRITVEFASSNLGGAGGFARGIETAQSQFDPDWMLLMDDDARPADGAIEAFRRLDLAGWDAIASAVYYPGGAICEMNRPSRNPFWSLRAFKGAIFKGRKGFHVDDVAFQAGQITEIDVGSFVGYFVSREAVRRAGLPDGRLFIYGDDVLYSLSIRRAGARIGFASDVAFEHDCGTRATHDGKRVQPLWKAYYLIRNKIIVYRNVAGPFFWLLLPGLLASWHLKAKNYGSDTDGFKRLRQAAIRDGLARDYSRAHDDVVRLSKRTA